MSGPNKPTSQEGWRRGERALGPGELTARRDDYRIIAEELLVSAERWEPQALILGNVRADEIAGLCRLALEWFDKIERP